MQWNDEKNTHTEVDMLCVWAEASWPCMEQIHGPGHVGNRFQAKLL